MSAEPIKPGHGDHWLAALDENDERLADALTFPTDAPDGVKLHRRALTEALDMVQITSDRRLVTAYPEPRATTLVTLRPRELAVWDTGVEGWIVGEHEGAGYLTIFLTDLIEHARRYERARGPIALEIGALAYVAKPAIPTAGVSRLMPAARDDPRFLPDDHGFTADVLAVREALGVQVLDLAFHGDLVIPTVVRQAAPFAEGDRVQGYLWLTGRWPSDGEEQSS